MHRMITCPVCNQKTGLSLVHEDKIYKILNCPSCGLEFSDPMEYNNQLYDNLYKKDTPDLAYTENPRITAFLTSHPMKAHRFLELNHVYAIKWIKNNYKQGTKILDIGCGSGSFLFALKHRGYEPYGMEVARSAVEELGRAGFNAAEGSLDDVPREWGSFDVVTVFEVLEHLPNPFEFLSSLRRRWPDASLILSAPDPRRVYLLFHDREAGDYPPHHLTRWTPQALKIILTRAGYRSIYTKRLRPRGSQIVARTGIIAFLRRKRDKTPQVGVDKPFYSTPAPIVAKDILFWPIAMVMWLLGWHNTQMIFVAQASSKNTRKPPSRNGNESSQKSEK